VVPPESVVVYPAGGRSGTYERAMRSRCTAEETLG
jgi:hypothetical protein